MRDVGLSEKELKNMAAKTLTVEHKAKGNPAPVYDKVGAIMQYEDGGMDCETADEFFRELAKSGLWRHLQGHYGRELHARGLI